MRTPRRPFHAPRASSADWDEAFSKPAPATLESFTTGELIVRLSGMVDLKAPQAAALEDKNARVPVYAHLVRHEKLGDFVVDPGLDRGYARSKAGSVRGLVAPILPIPGFQAEGEDLRSRLDALGSTPKIVFYTHLHFDHSAGALDMPTGIAQVAGAGESEFGAPLLADARFFRDAEAIEELDFSSGIDMPLLGPAIDLLGDGSLWAVSTPGHTKAHVSYLFNGRGGPALLAGDAICMRAILELGIGPGRYSRYPAMAKASADRIRAFVAAYPRVRVLTGHEL
jgi:glyoxylase-like metal-dependent hydrolase (beta-lactamase superfamily II)